MGDNGEAHIHVNLAGNADASNQRLEIGISGEASFCSAISDNVVAPDLVVGTDFSMTCTVNFMFFT